MYKQGFIAKDNSVILSDRKIQMQETGAQKIIEKFFKKQQGGE